MIQDPKRLSSVSTKGRLFSSGVVGMPNNIELVLAPTSPVFVALSLAYARDFTVNDEFRDESTVLLRIESYGTTGLNTKFSHMDFN